MKKIIIAVSLFVGAGMLLTMSCNIDQRIADGVAKALAQRPQKDTTDMQLREKMKVAGTEIYLVNHPDTNITMKGKDGIKYYLFYSKNYMLISEHAYIAKDIAEWLPVLSIEEHYVKITGPTIDPITIFTQEQLDEASKKLGLGLNNFKTVWIYTWNTKNLKAGEYIIDGNLMMATMDQRKIINSNNTPDPSHKPDPATLKTGRELIYPTKHN